MHVRTRVRGRDPHARVHTLPAAGAPPTPGLTASPQRPGGQVPAAPLHTVPWGPPSRHVPLRPHLPYLLASSHRPLPGHLPALERLLGAPLCHLERSSPATQVALIAPPCPCPARLPSGPGESEALEAYRLLPTDPSAPPLSPASWQLRLQPRPRPLPQGCGSHNRRPCQPRCSCPPPAQQPE